MTDRPGRTPERGAGLFGTAAGLLVFLLLMLVSVQILFNLHATSMVTDAAHDAARDVAGYDSAPNRCAAVAAAESAFVEKLGEYGSAGHAELQWSCADRDVITVRVVARHPSILPPRFGGLIALTELDRTIEVRVEDDR